MVERDPTLLQRLCPLTLMVFDVDGVLTDGTLYYGPGGEVLKAFNVLDGQGLRWLQDAGLRVAILSGRDSPMVTVRARELGIDWVIQGAADKRSAIEELIARHGGSYRETGFMGDDVPDIPVLRRVGFAATVPHAADGVAAHAHWMSARAGGRGAVREVCELILGAQGKLEPLFAAARS